jgi:hypothetical protein
MLMGVHPHPTNIAIMRSVKGGGNPVDNVISYIVAKRIGDRVWDKANRAIKKNFLDFA